MKACADGRGAYPAILSGAAIAALTPFSARILLTFAFLAGSPRIVHI